MRLPAHTIMPTVITMITLVRAELRISCAPCALWPVLLSPLLLLLSATLALLPSLPELSHFLSSVLLMLLHRLQDQLLRRTLSQPFNSALCLMLEQQLLCSSFVGESMERACVRPCSLSRALMERANSGGSGVCADW